MQTAYVEGGACSRSVERQAVGRSCQFGKRRGVGAAVVEREIGNVGVLAGEAYLRFHIAADTGKAYVVYLQRRHRGAPLGTLQVQHDAYLLGVGQRGEVSGVGLVAVGDHGQVNLVVGILQVGDAYLAQRRPVVLSALGQAGEGVDLVGGHVDHLRHLAGRPSVAPHVPFHRQHMVVLVHLVRPFLGLDVLCGVVLVVGIHVPALYAGGDVTRCGVVVLALEGAVLDEVLGHFAVFHAPFGLQRQVGDAQGVDGHAVAVYEHAAVGCHGIAVGVVKAVGVVERAAVGGVRDGLVAVVRRGAVEQSQRLAANVTFEAGLVGGHGKQVERAAAAGGLGLHLNGIAVLAGLETVEGHLLVGAAGISRVGRDVLHGKGRANAFKYDISTHVSTAKDDLAVLLVKT